MQQPLTREPAPAVKRSYTPAYPLLLEGPTDEGLPVTEPRPEERALPLTVESVEDEVGFAALQREWRELLAASAADCLFLTWGWLYTWWMHLSAGRRLKLLCVRRGHHLLGIAPLALRPPQPARLFPFPALEFLGAGNVGSDYLDLIIRRGEEPGVLNALVRYLEGCHYMLELGQVKLGSTPVARLAARLRDAGWDATQTVTQVCPYIPLAGLDWEGYLAGLGSAHRQNLRRRLRKLEGAFDVRFETVATEERRKACLPLFMELHRKRWAGRQGGSDALNSRELVNFHDAWSRLALRQGWLRLYVLWLDGTPAASIYGFRYGDVFYFYQSGFDPEFSRHSVGLAMLGYTVREALAEGAREYDLLHGDETYKFLWTDQGRDLSRLELYPPSARGRLYRRAVELRSSLKRLLRRAPAA